jgi:hypothetical protein
LVIEVDGKVVYTSPEISYLDQPVTFNVDISGGNDFVMKYDGIYYRYTVKDHGGNSGLRIGDAGFYQ